MPKTWNVHIFIGNHTFSEFILLPKLWYGMLSSKSEFKCNFAFSLLKRLKFPFSVSIGENHEYMVFI